jgi:glycosyltransferase involved in cell wall biosynthesis
MSESIILLAGIDSFSGYSEVAIAFTRGLASLGVDVKIRASSLQERFGAVIPDDIRQRIVKGPQSEPWELLIHPPNFVPTPGKKTAFLTMNESTRLNPVSVHLLNKATVVIVPSQFCANTFSACGVNVPIRVVPLGIDPEIFHWRPFPTGGVVFGAAGRVTGGGPRKNLDGVAEAFLAAFPAPLHRDVRLKIKCHPDCPIGGWSDPRIEITSEHLSAEKLADWYASLTCFVSASKGEGFGLHQLQAMATGRPMISAAFGGVTEFFDELCGDVIPHTLTPAPPPYCGHWAEISQKDLMDQMQLFYIFQTTAFDAGRQARLKVCEFTWQSATEKLMAVLREFGALNDAGVC